MIPYSSKTPSSASSKRFSMSKFSTDFGSVFLRAILLSMNYLKTYLVLSQFLLTARYASVKAVTEKGFIILAPP